MRATTGAGGRSAVRGASGVLAGGGSSRRAASSARSGRTGKVRVERPVVRVRVTGSGAGHAIGQSPVAMAIRMRLPAAKRWALSLSRRCTVTGLPGTSGITRSCVLVVGEVEDAEADEGHRAVRAHLREARAHLGDGAVARDLQGHDRGAEEGERLGERLGVEAE